MKGIRGPRVSVIVPAYNAARFIGCTLDNVLQQTTRSFEVIVVDDGSRDATPEIVEKFTRLDQRVHLFRQSNAGVSAARNTALRHARGDFVAPLDADDLWHPTKLQKQLEVFDAGPPLIGVVYCYFAVIDEDSRILGPRQVYNAPIGWVYPQLALGNIVGNASAPLIRRSTLTEVGGYDDNFDEGCEDLDVYLRLAERSKYALVPEFLVGYRRSGESMSMNSPRMERAINQLTRKMLDRHPDLPGRLIRWRNGNMYRYLALHAIMGRYYKRAFRLAAKSVISDPLLLIGWMLGRARRRVAAPLTAARPEFLTTDPAPTAKEAFSPSPVDARRQAQAARVRLLRISEHPL